MKRILAAFALAAIAGCSARAGGTAIVPQGDGAGAAPLKFSIRIPLASGARTARVSSNTQGVGVQTYLQSDTGHTNAIGYFGNDVSASSPNCTAAAFSRVCTIQAAAPAGADTFVVTTYDAVPDGSGNFPTAAALDTGTVDATIVQGASNTVAVTLGGIPSVLQLSIDNPHAGYDAHLYGGDAYTVEVSALDADGEQIIGSDPYATPIALGANATATTTVNGASSTLVHAPSDRVTLTESATHFATLGATAQGASAATASYNSLARGATTSYATEASPGAIASGTDADLYYGDAAQEIVRVDLPSAGGTALTYAGALSPEGGPIHAIVRFLFAGIDVSYVTAYDGAGVWVGNSDGSGAEFNTAQTPTAGDCGIANGYGGDRWLACSGGSIIDADSTAVGTATGPSYSPARGLDGHLWWLTVDPTEGLVVEGEDEASIGVDPPAVVTPVEASPDTGQAMLLVSCPDGNAYAAYTGTSSGPSAVRVGIGSLGSVAPLTASPTALACGPSGGAYIGEADGSVQWYRDGDGAVAIASLGNAVGGVTLGPDGAMWATVTADDKLWRIIP